MGSELKQAELEKILAADDKKKCLQFFRGMPEKTRREYFAAVLKPFWSRVRKNQMIEGPPGTFRWNPLDGIACIAYFATATGSEIIKAKRNGYPTGDIDSVFEVLADRRPDWTAEWVESLLSDTYYWTSWRLIRRLIQGKLLKKPTNPRYFLGMISAINQRANREINLAHELEKEPDLLKEDLWKLFEYDGEGENSLANTERFDQSWIAAFLELMNKGKLPRAKLLDSCVSALECDFNHYRAKWFCLFFDRLEPTEKELKKHAERLLGLLGASAPNVASWALNRVNRLASAAAFETSLLCHSLEPILRARAKGTVLSALKLLERQAAAYPKDSSLVAATAVQGLAHEAPDVQKAAINLLESISSPADTKIRDQVAKLQPSLAASVRGLAAKWLGAGASPAKSTGNEPASKSKPSGKQASSNTAASDKLPKLSKQLESLYAIETLRKNLVANLLAIPAVTFDGTEIQRLSGVPRVDPIETIEELIDVCARIIEDSSLVDDAERCIGGLARLAKSKPTDFDQMAGPLLKRVRKLISKGNVPFCGYDPSYDLLGLFYAFCTGKVIELKNVRNELRFDFEGEELFAFDVNTKKPIGFLSDHCQAVARRIAAGKAGQLLSTPTHVGGWIDPRELAKRANAWTGDDPHVQDVILAMLRLAPENRASALKALRDKPGDWLQALRYALGADKVKLGKEAALWVAAARARAPWQDDVQVGKKFPGLGPDAAEAAKLEFHSKKRTSHGYTHYDACFLTVPPTPKTSDPLLPTVTMYTSQSIGKGLQFEMGGFGGRTNGAIRWTATIWPLARESYFASCADQCFDNLDWWEARWQNRTKLEPLIDAGTPLRYAGLLFLVGMLAAKEPGESGLATDIAIRAIEEGRLGSDNLGEALATLVVAGKFRPARFQKKLSEIARASQVHAAVIQIALQRCFENPKAELPKDYGNLLELLHELSLELGVPVTNESCRTWLASGAATGKGSKLAKKLLALEARPESQQAVQTILGQAIAERTFAASRQVCKT